MNLGGRAPGERRSLLFAGLGAYASQAALWPRQAAAGSSASASPR